METGELLEKTNRVSVPSAPGGLGWLSLWPAPVDGAEKGRGVTLAGPWPVASSEVHVHVGPA